MVPHIQDAFLAECKSRGTLVTVGLTNQQVVHGVVKDFDAFTVLLEVETKMQLLYKHAIATIS